MDIPAGCKERCAITQLGRLEAAGEQRTVLCPMLAKLALNAGHQTPLIERHFLNLSAECAEKGPLLYKVQQVMGPRAVEAAVKIRDIIAPKDEEQSADEEAVELAA